LAVSLFLAEAGGEATAGKSASLLTPLTPPSWPPVSMNTIAAATSTPPSTACFRKALAREGSWSVVVSHRSLR
jgi:hypothetical protein